MFSFFQLTLAKYLSHDWILLLFFWLAVISNKYLTRRRLNTSQTPPYLKHVCWRKPQDLGVSSIMYRRRSTLVHHWTNAFSTRVTEFLRDCEPPKRSLSISLIRQHGLQRMFFKSSAVSRWAVQNPDPFARDTGMRRFCVFIRALVQVDGYRIHSWLLLAIYRFTFFHAVSPL